MVSGLHKDTPIRGDILVDEFGEPKYFLDDPSGWAVPRKRFVHPIKLTGELFTKSQKNQFKSEVRSKKIAELQAEVEQLKKQIDANEHDLKVQEQTIEDLKRELASCKSSKLKSKLKKLVGKYEE